MKEKEPKETKPVSFRLSAEVFEALQVKGQGMDLSPHELASKLVQENYKGAAPFQAVPLKEVVTCSKQVFLPPPSKQVFHFTLNDMECISRAICGDDFLASYVRTMRIGDGFRGIIRIDENLWEVEVNTSNAYYK